MPDDSSSVLIPVADPERAPQYIDLGARIAHTIQGDIVLLSIEVEEMEEASTSVELAGPAPAFLQELQRYAKDRNVAARIQQLKARNVAGGIVAAAQAPEVDYLIMGWRGDEEGGTSAIGQQIDGLIREASAHTIVMQERPFEENERILLPVLSGDLAPLSLAVASILAGSQTPSITVLHLAPSIITDEEKEKFQNSLFDFEEATQKHGSARLIRSKDAFEISFKTTNDPVRILLEVVENHDRLVMEARQTQALRDKVHEGYRVSLAEEVSRPLVLVRPKNQDVKFGI